MGVVENVHERAFCTDLGAAGALIDSLASPADRLWPADRWPAMRFDQGLRVGARGGHGPVRYRILSYEPGGRIVFQFCRPVGFRGTHGFVVREEGAGMVRLSHTLRMETAGWARLSWPIFFRPLHDAVLEDALDRAAVSLGLSPQGQRWSFWVRVLRWIYRRKRTHTGR